MNRLFGANTEDKNKEIKILSKDYLPFDDEKNFEKKEFF
jgi:hypothetical protein